MNGAIVFAASDLLYVMAVAFVGWWVVAERRTGRISVVVASAVGGAVMALLIVVSSHLHTDPRPFVQHPGLRPLVPHVPDNGFPSDHSSAAGLLATLSCWRRWWWGAVLALAALLVAAGRLGAHLHHVQDVAAGLGIGLAAGLIGVAAARFAEEGRWRTSRR